MIGAGEVADHLGVARSTAYRYVQSLVQSGFLEEAETGKLRLGRRILELAIIARRGLGLSDVARPVMRRLCADLGETVLLTRLAGNAVICLEREEASTQRVRISYERGQVLPINAGASAFVLLAWLDDEPLDQVLPPLPSSGSPVAPSPLGTRSSAGSRRPPGRASACPRASSTRTSSAWRLRFGTPTASSGPPSAWRRSPPGCPRAGCPASSGTCVPLPMRSQRPLPCSAEPARVAGWSRSTRPGLRQRRRAARPRPRCRGRRTEPERAA